MSKIGLYPQGIDQRRSTEVILRNASGVTEWTYVPTATGMQPIAFVVCISDHEFADIAAQLEALGVLTVRFSRLPRDAAGYVDIPSLMADACNLAQSVGAVAHAPGPPSVLDGGPLDLPDDYPCTLVAALDRASQLTPTHGIKFVDASGNEIFVSYRTLCDRARTFARVLAPFSRAGLQYAVICCADRAMFVHAFWACQFAGMTVVPYETQTGGADPVLALVAMLDILSSVVVLNGKAEQAWAQDPRLAGRCMILAIASPEQPADAAVDLQAPNPKDQALLLSTSGSTGATKMVIQSHDRLLGYAAGSIVAFGFGPDMVSLNWLPLTHVGGLVMYHIRDVLAGCQQVIVETTFVLRRPRTWLELIDRYKVTNSWAPNFAYSMVTEDLRRHPDFKADLSSMDFMLNGGELISAEQATSFLAATERFRLKPTAMVPAWGMSETCSGVLYGSRMIPSLGPVPVGRPLPGCKVRIVDDHGATMAQGQMGELQVKGRSVMGGYFCHPDTDVESFSEDGWLRTGDLAVIDEKGTTICGRIKDTVIVNGVNFSLVEIERAAESAAEIEPTFSAAVAIRSETDTTERILLLVVPRTDVDPELAIRAATRAVEDSIGIRPAWVRAVNRAEIPRTVLGKIRRQDIQRYWVDRLIGPSVEHEVSASIHIQRWQAFQPAPRPKQANPLLFVNATSRLGFHADNFNDVRVVESPSEVRVGLADLVSRALTGIMDDGNAIELMIAVEPAVGDQVPGTSRALSIILQLCDVGRILTTVAVVRPIRLSVLLYEADPIDDLLWQEPVQAFLRCLTAEQRGIQTRAVRISPGANLAPVLRAAFSPHELALEGNQLSTRVISAALPEQVGTKPFTAGNLYVVSGGLGEIGYQLCQRLINRYGARLIIMGSKVQLPPAQQQRLKILQERTSVTYLAWSGRPSSLIELREVIAKHSQDAGSGGLAGVFHLAGSLAYGPLDEKFEDRLEEAWEAKAFVADVLFEAARDNANCPIVFFSSLTSHFGGVNVGAHAVANAYLDAICERANVRRDARVYSIDWSVWAEIGQSTGRTDPEAARLRGFHPLSLETGFEALDEILLRPPGSYMVGLMIDTPSVAWRADKTSVQLGSSSSPAGSLAPSGSAISASHEIPTVTHGLFKKETTLDEITAIWCSVLNLEFIDPADSFFDLGGTSLLVPQVLEGITTRFGIKLKAVDIFRFPTVSTLSAHVSRIMAG